LEEIMKISSRGTPVQEDPYKKYLSKGQEALVHRKGAWLQPTNLLLKFQLKTGTTSSGEPPRYKTRNYSLGASNTDILLKGSTSSIPTVGEVLAYVVSGVSGFRLAKKALSRFTNHKLQKARTRANKVGTGGIQQPGSSDAPLRCPLASSESAVEISAKDRDEPVVQNLPEENGW
jgi:hypothetical protein